MLFKKNKYIEVNQGRLAQAISIVSDNINMEKDYYSFKLSDYDNVDTIEINEDIKICIDRYSYKEKGGFMYGFHYYVNYFVLKLSTFIGDVCVNSYTLRLDMKEDNNIYRDWFLENKEIYHPIPNEIAKIINDWSQNITDKKYQEINNREKEIDLCNEINYHREESYLNKIFCKYKRR